MATSQHSSASLKPRRSKSVSENQLEHHKAQRAAPPNSSPRRTVSCAESHDSRRRLISESQVNRTLALPDSVGGWNSTVSREVMCFKELNRQIKAVTCDKHIRSRQRDPVHEDVIESIPRYPRPSLPVTRHTSLYYSGQFGRALRSCPASVSDLHLETSGRYHPRSQPPSRAGSMGSGIDCSSNEPSRHPVISCHVHEDEQQTISRASSRRSVLGPIPKPSFSRFSTYDGFRSYKEEKAAWKRASIVSSIGNPHVSEPDSYAPEALPTTTVEHGPLPRNILAEEKQLQTPTAVPGCPTTPDSSSPPPSVLSTSCKQYFDQHRPRNRFRHFAAEVGFCFTVAMTQFLAEYMISGFAIELPKIIKHQEVRGMGWFWPASLLSLILSATLLVFARISDMYGGYFPFVFGVVWLGIWSLVAGFTGFGTLLDVARAMQGMAIAAFIPSTFAMIGSIYPEGPRKNTVLGLYSGCAPLGFFAGFLVAGALPESAPGWYFWIAAALSFITAITAWLTVPHDRTDRKELELQMDWHGACLITVGLILMSYALAAEPYANGSDPSQWSWTYPTVLAPLMLGLACLLLAFWVEGWYASCPLLPFDFFRKQSTKSLSMACLCFYATYGVWLYESARFFQSPKATGTEKGMYDITLAAWYTPTAVGGLVLCVASGTLLHVVPIMALLLVSAMAWMAAPLLLALCPTPINYWAYVMPSMLCATLGIDLTFTVSVVFLSAVQPLRYQGLAGAVSSILVNLAMSFSLSISNIVCEKAKSTVPDERKEIFGFQSAFLYATASAGVGLIICALFVRISRSVVQEKSGEEDGRALSEAPTRFDV